MRRLIFFLMLFVIHSYSYTQDYDSYSVDKKVSEFAFDNDFTAPLNAFISIQYLLANGRFSELYKKSSFKIRAGDLDGWIDRETTKEFQTKLRNYEIKRVITYSDSVAAVITTYQDSSYLYRYLNLEQDIWVNGGEGMSDGLEVTENKIRGLLPLRLNQLRRTNKILDTPTDTVAFVNYLKENGKSPRLFLLDALAEHKLVIYGERHREKLSWQLLKDLVNDPAFRKTTGVVFMELPSYEQDKIDKFFGNREYADSAIIFDIYRDMQFPGWYDKGGFEFLITLWELNNKLPEKEKIKVVLTDFQMPIREIRTKEEFQNFINNNAIKRNTNMADIIEQTIKTSSDLRNNLFIVGYAHAYKSSAINEYGESPESDYSAANQLVERFLDQDVFCTRIHTSGLNGYIRGGMFDSVFAKNGGQSMAFKLKGSPFGREIIEEWIWEKDEFGSFENNYDGYIYLGGEPIDKHPEYRLADIYTEDFVKEIKRRAYLCDDEDEMWFGVPNKSLTLEAVLKDLNNE